MPHDDGPRRDERRLGLSPVRAQVLPVLKGENDETVRLENVGDDCGRDRDLCRHLLGPLVMVYSL